MLFAYTSRRISGSLFGGGLGGSRFTGGMGGSLFAGGIGGSLLETRFGTSLFVGGFRACREEFICCGLSVESWDSSNGLLDLVLGLLLLVSGLLDLDFGLLDPGVSLLSSLSLEFCSDLRGLRALGGVLIGGGNLAWLGLLKPAFFSNIAILPCILDGIKAGFFSERQSYYCELLFLCKLFIDPIFVVNV